MHFILFLLALLAGTLAMHTRLTNPFQQHPSQKHTSTTRLPTRALSLPSLPDLPHHRHPTTTRPTNTQPLIPWTHSTDLAEIQKHQWRIQDLEALDHPTPPHMTAMDNPHHFATDTHHEHRVGWNPIRWFTQSVFKPLIARQIRTSIELEFHLIRSEIDRLLPSLSDYEDPKTVQLYLQMPARARPVFLAVLKIKGLFRHLAKALRDTLVHVAQEFFTSEQVQPIIEAVSEAVIQTVAVKPTQPYFRRQDYTTDLVALLHVNIMKNVERNGLDRMLNAYATKLSKAAALAVRRFFFSAVNPSIRPHMLKKMMDEGMWDDVVMMDLPSDHQQQSHVNQRPRAPLLSLDHLRDSSALTMKTTRRLASSLSRFSIESIATFIEGMVYAYSGLIKNVVRLVLFSGPVRQRIKAMLERQVLSALAKDWKLNRLPEPVCPENAHLTLDNILSEVSSK